MRCVVEASVVANSSLRKEIQKDYPTNSRYAATGHTGTVKRNPHLAEFRTLRWQPRIGGITVRSFTAPGPTHGAVVASAIKSMPFAGSLAPWYELRRTAPSGAQIDQRLPTPGTVLIGAGSVTRASPKLAAARRSRQIARAMLVLNIVLRARFHIHRTAGLVVSELPNQQRVRHALCVLTARHSEHVFADAVLLIAVALCQSPSFIARRYGRR